MGTMKRELKRAFAKGFMVVIGLLSVAPKTVQAVTYYWDVNGSGAGFGTASGTWGSDTYWTPDGTGAFSGTPVTDTGTGDTVNFGNGTTGLSAGTVAVTGAAQVFSNMTFAVGSGAILLSGGTLNLAPSSTITVNNTADTISTDLQGSSGLTKAGAGTLTLSGSNTFSGGLTVSAGKLWLLDNTMDLGSGAVVLNNTSTMNLTNGTVTSGVMTVGNNSTSYTTLNLYSNAVWNVGGAVTVGNNWATANQVNILGGRMSVTGGVLIKTPCQTTLSDGDLVVECPGNVAVNVAGTLTINSGTLTANNCALSISGNGTVNQSGGTVTLSGSGAFGYNWSSCPKYNLSGGSLILTNGANIRGMNNLTASGDADMWVGAPTGSGYMQFGDGTLNPVFTITNNAQVTFASSPKINNATSGRTILRLDGGVLSVPGFVASTGTNSIYFNGGTLLFSAKTIISSSALSTFNVYKGGASIDTGAYAVTNNQALINASTGGLTKLGTGLLSLGGASTYVGPTTVSAGTLKAGVASVADVSGAFGRNSAVTLANVAGAKLDITGYNTQIGSLAGGGATGGNVTLGAATLTVGGDDSPAAYSGVISSSGSPTTSLIKTGNGALVLNGVNTYTGATTVNSGILGGTGTIGGTTTVATNAFVSGGSTNNVGTFNVMNLTLQEGAGVIWNYGTATQDRIAVSGTLTLPAYGVVNVSAAEGATSSQLPTLNVLMTYTSSSGAISLDNWIVNGVTSARVRLDWTNKRLLLIINRGTLISIM